MNNSNNLTILIDSFDGYSDLWEYFFKIFDMFWNDCPYPKKLVSNEKSFYGIETIKTGPEIDWVSRTIKAINEISTPYIMLLLEDYFFGNIINSEKIYDLMESIVENDYNYVRLIEIPKSRTKRKNNTMCPIYKNEEYGINLQASIWKVSFLKDILFQIKNGSAWDFEVYLLKKTLKESKVEFNGCYTLKGNPFKFHNGVLKGKWFRREIKYYKRFGIEINSINRGVLGRIEEKKFIFSQWIKNILPYWFRRIVKKILKKFGFKFVSDL